MPPDAGDGCKRCIADITARSPPCPRFVAENAERPHRLSSLDRGSDLQQRCCGYHPMRRPLARKRLRSVMSAWCSCVAKPARWSLATSDRTQDIRWAQSRPTSLRRTRTSRRSPVERSLTRIPLDSRRPTIRLTAPPSTSMTPAICVAVWHRPPAISSIGMACASLRPQPASLASTSLLMLLTTSFNSVSKRSSLTMDGV